MKHDSARLVLVTLVSCLTVALSGRASSIDLFGSWRFQLDPDNVGMEEAWFNQNLPDEVRLPGTTDENKKGLLNKEAHIDRLFRVWEWKGPAWYQREVEIPESWRGKRITLFLERTKNCQVWVNGSYCGWDDTLSAPHIHDLSEALKPGTNTITLLVDNSKLPPVGPSHQVDERTQTNWNGVVGTMELRATDPVWLEDVQVYPDVAQRQAKVRLVIGNATGVPAACRLRGRRRDGLLSAGRVAQQAQWLQRPRERGGRLL